MDDDLHRMAHQQHQQLRQQLSYQPNYRGAQSQQPLPGYQTPQSLSNPNGRITAATDIAPLPIASNGGGGAVTSAVSSVTSNATGFSTPQHQNPSRQRPNNNQNNNNAGNFQPPPLPVQRLQQQQQQQLNAPYPMAEEYDAQQSLRNVNKPTNNNNSNAKNTKKGQADYGGNSVPVQEDAVSEEVSDIYFLYSMPHPITMLYVVYCIYYCSC